MFFGRRRTGSVLNTAWIALVVSLTSSVSAAVPGQDSDPYKPNAKITKGWMRELPVLPVKRSIKYLSPDDAARFHPKDGEVVFANFEHEGKFYIAVVNPKGVDKATFQIMPFGNLPTHTHSNLRFTMKDGQEIRLYPQSATSDSASPALKLKDLIISDEGFSPSGGRWKPGVGLVNDEFALAYRVNSIDQVLYESYVLEPGRKIIQFPLCLEKDSCSTLLKNNLDESDAKGLNETYHLLQRNCTSELFRQIDAVTATSPLAKAAAWLGNFAKWVPGWSKQALACRGLLDKKAAESIPNLEVQEKTTLERLRAKYTKLSSRPPKATWPESKRVLLVWLSTGQGHKSAAEGIAEQIRKKDPNAVVVLKDIKDFAANKFRTDKEEDLYWYLVKNHPDIFDKLFRGAMKDGVNIPHIKDIAHQWDEQKFLNFIKEGNFDTVVSTYYGGAALTGKLADEGKLPGIKTGWLHTDYFRGYFPRISQQVNRTFLGESSLEDVWKEWGVKPDAVQTAGMPFPNTLYEPVDKATFFKEVNEKYSKLAGDSHYEPLDPNVRTITITGGGEGVGDFPAYVRSLAANAKGDLQIVAVAAKNEKHIAALKKIIESGELAKLSKHKINLKVLGYTPLPEVLSFIKSSDIYITKSGGLSPAEGFVIGRPMIITDVYGGHERDNADLFEKRGLGLVNRKPEDIGLQANQILEDSALTQRMAEAQERFRNDVNIKKVVDFIYDDSIPLVHPEQQFAVGEQETTQAALKRLEYDAPSDVEVILPLSKDKKNQLAIRVRDTVYTAPGQTTTLKDYLYGADGISYGQNAVSVRLRKISPSSVDTLVHALESSDQKAKNGLEYVTQALRASKLNLGTATSSPSSDPLKFIAQLTHEVEKDPSLGLDVVNYAQVHSPSKSPQKAWSRQIAQEPGLDSLVPYTKRLTTYVANPGLVYENINSSSVGRVADRKRELIERYQAASRQIVKKEKETEEFMSRLREENLTPEGLNSAYEKLRKHLTPEQLALVAANEPDKLPPGLRLQAIDYLAFQKKVDSALTRKLAMIDDLTQLKLDHIIDQAMDAHRLVKEELLSTMDDKTRAPIEAIVARMEKEYRQYHEFKKNYGLPKDGPTRTMAYRKFFQSVQELEQKIREWKVPELPAAKRSALEKVKEIFTQIYSTLRTVVNYAPDVANLVRSLFFPKEPQPGKLDLIHGVNKAFRTMAKNAGISVEIEGKELLPVSSDPKVINVITPTHRLPFNDAMIMSHFMPDDALLFGAGDQFVEQLKSTGSRNVVIYPEGSVSTGMGETRPPRAKFAWGLLDRLEKEGYRVNLVPVTYLNSDRLMHLGGIGPEDGEKVLRARISKPVSPEQLKVMTASGDPQAINRYLRSVWLENLPTDSYHLAGQWRMPAIERVAVDRLRGGSEPIRIEPVSPERCLDLFRLLNQKTFLEHLISH